MALRQRYGSDTALRARQRRGGAAASSDAAEGCATAYALKGAVQQAMVQAF